MLSSSSSRDELISSLNWSMYFQYSADSWYDKLIWPDFSSLKYISKKSVGIFSNRPESISIDSRSWVFWFFSSRVFSISFGPVSGLIYWFNIFELIYVLIGFFQELPPGRSGTTPWFSTEVPSGCSSTFSGFSMAVFLKDSGTSSGFSEVISPGYSGISSGIWDGRPLDWLETLI